MSRAISAFEAVVSTLSEQLAAAISRADRAEADRRQVETDRGAAIALADQTVALLKDAVARADRAEQGREGDRARADALRDRLEVLQAQLTAVEVEGAASDVTVAELTAQLKEARANAQAAQDRAEAITRADEARQARGILARLKTALRGE